MLNDQSEIIIKRTRRAREPASALRSLKRSGEPYDYNVKSATRALEVIELFGVHLRDPGDGWSDVADRMSGMCR